MTRPAGMVSVAEVAERLGVHRTAVNHRAMKRGIRLHLLKDSTYTARTFVRVEDLEALLAEQKRGPDPMSEAERVAANRAASRRYTASLSREQKDRRNRLQRARRALKRGERHATDRQAT